MSRSDAVSVDWRVVSGLALTIVPVLEVATWMENQDWCGFMEA